MLPTLGKVFSGFGPSKFMRVCNTSYVELTDDYAQVRTELRQSCPTTPGIYGMIDCADRLIYVGMSRHLRNRTITYFQSDGATHRVERYAIRKESRIASRAHRLVWQNTDNELLALLREQELIRRFAPEMNVRGRRRRRMVYVYLSTGESPRFCIAAQLPKSCRYHWGPVAQRGRLARLIETLNRYFRLADCAPEVPIRYADQHNLFELDLYPLCLRGQVNRCLAPCAGLVSRAGYVAQLNRARAFLDGRDDAPIDDLDRRLYEAAGDRRFEQAAALRDLRNDLTELRDRLIPQPNLLPTSFVYEIPRANRPRWMAVHETTVMKVAPMPRDSRGARLWRDRLDRWRSTPQPLVDEREGSELAILAAWFRRHSEELSRVIDFERAKSFCRGF